MKKTSRFVFSTGFAVAMSIGLVANPALAAIDFDTASWTVGGVNYEFGIGPKNITTPTQSNGSFDSQWTAWGDVQGMDLTYGLCPGASATESTESNGDVIIECAPLQFSPTDVWFTQSFRFYNDEPLSRTMMSFENRGATDIRFTGGGNLNSSSLSFKMRDNSASSSNNSTCANLRTDDNWIAMAGSSNTTITGVAWQARGETAVDASTRSCTIANNIYVLPTLETLPAGATVNYMNFIATDEPALATQESMDEAFAAFKVKMASFDSLNDMLCRGLDANIEGWGTCVRANSGPGSNPEELAKTGASSSVNATSLLMATGLLAAGIFAMIASRRRRAHN